jgi:hypothetical protein
VDRFVIFSLEVCVCLTNRPVYIISTNIIVATVIQGPGTANIVLDDLAIVLRFGPSAAGECPRKGV